MKQWSPAQRLLLFPNQRGHVRHYPSFLTTWRSLLCKAKVPYRPYHSTRHSYATWLLSEGRANLQWVQHQLGHATIGQIMDTYARCVPEAHEHAVESVEPQTSEAQVWLYEQTGQKGKLDTNFKTAKDYATQALKAGFKVNDDELPRSEP